MPEIVVCIASFKRPDDLRRLLESLLRQRGVDGRYGLAIVDNDPAGSARSTVDTMPGNGVPVCYAIEPDPGIPAARNRSLALAREMGATCVAFIDDDEVASEGWLAALYRRLNTDDADSVSGPVEPLFPESAPGWAAASRLYHRQTFEAGAELDYASTANSMLRLAAVEGIEQPFHPAFRFTGGSDSYLYHSLRSRGSRIVWEPDALVYEYVPEHRTSMRWLVARSYRQGITLARCDRMIYGTPKKTLGRFVRGLAQIPVGSIEFGIGIARRRVTSRRALARIARGLGSIVGLFGVTYQEYRRPEGSDSDSQRSSDHGSAQT